MGRSDSRNDVRRGICSRRERLLASSTIVIHHRHPPSDRSNLLITFIIKLDICVEATIKRVNPRIERQLALPKVLPIPKFAKDWTIKCDGDNTEKACELTTIYIVIPLTYDDVRIHE